MRLFGSTKKNTAVRILVLFCVFFFAADIFDLRDELLNTDNFNGYPNDNIKMGIHSDHSFNPSLSLIFHSYSETASVAISGFHNMPCSNRASPA
jgi:hypothetical protein